MSTGARYSFCFQDRFIRHEFIEGNRSCCPYYLVTYQSEKEIGRERKLRPRPCRRAEEPVLGQLLDLIFRPCLSQSIEVVVPQLVTSVVPRAERQSACSCAV